MHIHNWISYCIATSSGEINFATHVIANHLRI